MEKGDKKMTERKELLTKSRRLRSEMRRLGPMIKGSVIFREMKCGKPNCHCARGRPHFYLCITFKEVGKIKTVYVSREREAQALVWSGNYKKFKQLLKEHSKINHELLKSTKKANKKR